MSASINLHHLQSVRAHSSGAIHWLEMKAYDGSFVSVFMPYETARAMADAFNAAQEPKHVEAAE